MRQLDSCDFCADTADGVFEVVPASVADGPVRLALCGDCQATLQTVVDPLLESDGSAPPATAGTQTTTEPEPETGRESDASASDDDGSEEADTDDGVTIEEQGGGSPARRPDGYAQLLRLLQNRDGAMERDDLRALATNAYELTGEEYEAAVEAAVDNGDVEETPEGLRTT